MSRRATLGDGRASEWRTECSNVVRCRGVCSRRPDGEASGRVARWRPGTGEGRSSTCRGLRARRRPASPRNIRRLQRPRPQLPATARRATRSRPWLLTDICGSSRRGESFGRRGPAARPVRRRRRGHRLRRPHGGGPGRPTQPDPNDGHGPPIRRSHGLGQRHPRPTSTAFPKPQRPAARPLLDEPRRGAPADGRAGRHVSGGP
jgi:hypothetical protein